MPHVPYPGWPPPLPRKDAPPEEFNAWARDNYFWHQAQMREMKHQATKTQLRWTFSLLMVSLVFNAIVFVLYFVEMMKTGK